MSEERAKQLLEKETLTEEEKQELEYLIEETKDMPTIKQYDPVKPIADFRKIQLENQRRKDELEQLRQERKALELVANIRKEKEKINKLKSTMDQPKVKRFWCLDCQRYEDKDGNPL